MTWYASEFITSGDFKSLNSAKSSPLFADHTFHVTNPLRFTWHTPEVEHDVPADGLMFIRPICDAEDHIAEWHCGEILPWERFADAPGVDISLTPESIKRRVPHLEFQFPPIQILRIAKKLHMDTKAPVAFYFCFFWGGDPEIEYAWIFDGSERVLIRLTDDLSTNVNQLLEIDQTEMSEHNDDVLSRALRALSCCLPTPFFAPHTRQFDWESVRV